MLIGIPDQALIANGFIADSRATAILTSIPNNIEIVQTNGYYAYGDNGGGTYKRVNAAPAHMGYFQSADGAYWEYTNAPANVLAFGAKGIGDSFDDTTYIQNAVDYAFIKNCDVVYPANVGDGYYKISKNITCKPGVSHTGLNGYAKLKNLSNSTIGLSGIFLSGNFHPDFTSRLTVYSCGTIVPGLSVTLANIADAANFAVGDQVWTCSNTTVSAGGFNIPIYMNLNYVENIAGAVITLRYPITNTYAGGISKLASVITTGRPAEIPLFFNNDATFSFLDIECTGKWISDSANYNVTFENNIIRSQVGMYGNAYQSCVFTNNIVFFSNAVGETSHNSINNNITNNNYSFKAVAGVAVSGYNAFGECAINNLFDSNVINYNSADFGNACLYVSRGQSNTYSNNTLKLASATNTSQGLGCFGQTADFFCVNNKFINNSIIANQMARFVDLNGVNSNNTNNVIENNSFNANTLTASSSAVRVQFSTNNSIKNNMVFVGQLSLSGASTDSTANSIVNNYFDGGFASEIFTDENYYKLNTIRLNGSSKWKAKQVLKTNTAANINVGIGATVQVLDCNVGANLITGDVITSEMYVSVVGNNTTRAIRFHIYNNTDVADIPLFTHTIPATSTAPQYVKCIVYVLAGTFNYYAEVYDSTTTTTTRYIGSASRPSSLKSLSYQIEGSSAGGNTQLNIPKIINNISNPYFS